MIIDGRAIAGEIKEELKNKVGQMDEKLSLAVFAGREDLATRKFIEIKKRFADDIGVSIEVKSLPGATTDKLVKEIQDAAKSCNGIIVQFPLESGIDTDIVRNAIPLSLDIDVLSDEAVSRFARGEFPILPPVAGAIAEIVRRNNVVLEGKRVVVVGEGRLVGKPASIWARLRGANVTTLNAESYDISYEIRKADILILGAGVPYLIKPDMVKGGVVIFDAGTSEASGKLVGDADPRCAEKASLFTPVPGGIGPITVAMIFKNLVRLKSLNN